MTDAQRAALKPGDTVLVRAIIASPYADASPAAWDAGDHVRVRVGHQTFYAPVSETLDVIALAKAA